MAVFPFIIFHKWAGSFLLDWKFLSHLYSWFFFLCSPRYQPLLHELLVSKPSDSFFCIIRWLIGTYLFSFLGTPLNYLNLTLALLHNLRIPGSWQSPGILAHFLPLGSPAIYWPWQAGLFFSLRFISSKAYPLMGLGSSLRPLMDLGQPPFFFITGSSILIFY